MKQKRRMKNLLVGLTTLVVMFGLTIVVSAITIMVDGDRESAWNGVGGQIPGLANDPNEPGINDNVDIEVFQWTNDQTNFYFLIGTYDPPSIEGPVDICLDTDVDVSTDIPPVNTTQRDRCNYGSGVTGIDTVIRIRTDGFGGVDDARVIDVSVVPPVTLGNAIAGHVPTYLPPPPNPVVELSVPLSLLGFNSTTCITGIPAVVYYDGGDTNPDDNLPDSGSINIDCGSPTAVSLGNFTAMSNGVSNAPQAIAVVALLVLALLSFGFVMVRRQSAQS